MDAEACGVAEVVVVVAVVVVWGVGCGEEVMRSIQMSRGLYT